MGGQLDISGNTALTGLPGNFGAVASVTGDLFLSTNGFAALDNAFPVRSSFAIVLDHNREPSRMLLGIVLVAVTCTICLVQ